MGLKIVSEKRNVVPNLSIIDKSITEKNDTKGRNNSKFKSNIRSSREVSVSSEIKSPEEYERIWREMGYPVNFTPEDMKWIDIHLSEDPNVHI